MSLAAKKIQISWLLCVLQIQSAFTRSSKPCFTLFQPSLQTIRDNGFSLRNSHKSKISTFKPLEMSLLPVDRDTLSEIITKRLPTPAQYATYWGRTSREQYNAAFEAFGVSFLGVFAAYFLSFAVGDFIATICGCVAGFWVLLGPELKAYQRNWELTGLVLVSDDECIQVKCDSVFYRSNSCDNILFIIIRGRELVDPWSDDDIYDYEDENNRGLYGALYLGRISHVCVVEDPLDPPEEEFTLKEMEGYTMETDDLETLTGKPYNLRLRVTDDKISDYGGDGRELQIHTRMSEEYLDLEPGMPVSTLLLSASQKFESLAALTDFCIPDAGPVWVGDYPYIDRPVLENLFAKDDELWDALREEGRGPWDEREFLTTAGDDADSYDDDDEYNY